jgi:glutamate transport system substrate-binding protein
MRFSRTTAALAVVGLSMSLGLSACGGDDSGSSGGGSKFVIGIKFDQPGLGFKNPDGTFSGFDVDMARYIAKGLGHKESDIEFKETVSANRETFIQNGSVDIILATYSITDERKQKVDFAGPYFIAGQDLLVRSDDNSITGPDTLNGKKLCSVTGSTSAQKVKDTLASKVQLQEFDSYSKCVTALLGGQIDALTTDNTILAGYAAQNKGQLKLVGKPFSEERYGVGLKKGDDTLRNKINDLIEKSFTDGTWEKAFNDNLGPSGMTLPAPPKVDRY